MRITAYLVVLLSVAADLGAQGATEFVPPPRVRITGALEATGQEGKGSSTLPRPGKRLTGTLVAEDRETVTIQTAARAEPLRVSRRALASIEVSRGRRSRFRGALFGFGVGFIAGFAAASTCSPSSSSLVDLCHDSGFALYAGGMLALPGALIGLALPPGERWEHIPMVRPAGTTRLQLAPQRGGGVGLGLSIAF